MVPWGTGRQGPRIPDWFGPSLRPYFPAFACLTAQSNPRYFSTMRYIHFANGMRLVMTFKHMGWIQAWMLGSTINWTLQIHVMLNVFQIQIGIYEKWGGEGCRRCICKWDTFLRFKFVGTQFHRINRFLTVSQVLFKTLKILRCP